MKVRPPVLLLLAALLALPLGCATDTSKGGGGGGTDSGDGDHVVGTGGVGTGGMAEGTGGTVVGAGGVVVDGGEGTGGKPGADAGSPTDDVLPSPGCNVANNGRPPNGVDYDAGTSWLIFPDSYDGTTPYPVVFGWHGCGSYNFGDGNRTEWLDATRNSGFQDNYIVAAPLAQSGSCYSYATDIVRSKALYDQLTNDYCVDMSRVFGTGHSSGAGFVVEILANPSDAAHFDFRGIAPVSAWVVGGSWQQVPAMYIQGVTDSERGGANGQDVVDKFTSTNQCSPSSMPYAAVDACNSDHDGAPVDAGCIGYDGCSATTVWCSHDDSSYGGTFHGIPCFFRQAAYDFFQSL